MEELQRRGKRLRALREKLGLKQWQVAEQVGVAANNYALWETGKQGIASRYLNKLAEVLKSTPNEIMGIENGEPPPVDLREVAASLTRLAGRNPEDFAVVARWIESDPVIKRLLGLESGRD